MQKSESSKKEDTIDNQSFQEGSPDKPDQN